MRLVVLSTLGSHAIAHYAMAYPAPDFGTSSVPEDYAFTSGNNQTYWQKAANIWSTRRQAFWYNQGAMIGCKQAKGARCFQPGKDCCGDTMEPTIPKKHLTFQTHAKQKAQLHKELGGESWFTSEAEGLVLATMFHHGAPVNNPLMKEAPLKDILSGFPADYFHLSDRNPWNAPGYAPVRDACGVNGGFPFKNPAAFACALETPGGAPSQLMNINLECGKPGDTQQSIDIINNLTSSMQYGPGTLGSSIVDKFLKTGEGNQPLTKWVKGGEARVAQGYWVANHGGGYQYRICPEKDFSSDGVANEECFQAHPLDYASPNSWIEYGDGRKSSEFKAERFTEGVSPKGSVWSVLRIPNCGSGTCNSLTEPYGLQIAEAVKGMFLALGSSGPYFAKYGETEHGFNEYIKGTDWTYWDKVKVPSELPAGRYVLGWRWDSEHSPQVWANCAVIELVDGDASGTTGASHYATSATVNHFTDTQFGAVATISAVALIALGAFAVTFSRRSGQKTGVQAPLTEKTQYSSI